MVVRDKPRPRLARRRAHRAATVAELAAAAEITERSTYRILGDLQQAGYVQRRKVGRHNTYEINLSMPLREPIVENESVGIC